MEECIAVFVDLKYQVSPLSLVVAAKMPETLHLRALHATLKAVRWLMIVCPWLIT